jgi:hypothetical protein
MPDLAAEVSAGSLAVVTSLEAGSTSTIRPSIGSASSRIELPGHFSCGQAAPMRVQMPFCSAPSGSFTA